MIKLSKTIFLIFLLNNQIQAEQISDDTRLNTVREAQHTLTLNGGNCLELEAEFKNIRKWSENTLKEENISEPNCVCDKKFKKGRECKIDIDNVAPNIVKMYQDKTPKFNGPNCWNNTLVSTGILPHLRYSDPDEMEFWMKSPLCKEKKITDKMEPGDAIAIRTNEGEYHGFIYISDKMSWSKNGYSKRSKYDLQTTENVFDVYKVPENCQRITTDQEVPKECTTFGNVYQCRSWDDYWNEVKETANVDEEIDSKLNNIDCLTSKYVFGDISPSPQTVSLIEASLDAIAFEVMDLKNKLTDKTPEAESIYVQRAVHRINSLKTQYELTSAYY